MTLEDRLLETYMLKHGPEAARKLESMDSGGASEVLQALSAEARAEVLRHVSPVIAAAALDRLTEAEAAQMLLGTRLDVAAAVLRVTSPARRAGILEQASPKPRAELKRLLQYKENTAGALMDPQVKPVAETSSVAEALEQIRKWPRHGLYYVYVVAADQALVGAVNVRELLQARPEQLVGALATRPAEAISTRSSWRVAMAHPGWHRLHALPVVDDDGRFAGVLRYEVMRNLERQTAALGAVDQGAETGAALGELYGIGLRGVLESAGSLLLGTPSVEETGR